MEYLSSPSPSLLGFVFSTHRPKEWGPEALTYFPYEAAIAAISIGFFRSTVCFKDDSLRWFFAAILAALAYTKRSYELIIAVEMFSYVIPWVLVFKKRSPALAKLGWITGGAVGSLLLGHFLVSRRYYSIIIACIPSPLFSLLKYMFPIHEMNEAWEVLSSFSHPIVLQKQVSHLLFVTFHIQVGMGYIGIDFLRKEQNRRNQLIRLDVVDDESEPTTTATAKTSASKSSNSTANGGHVATDKGKLQRAQRFQRGAGPFILFTALPYMFQIILYGNINMMAFTCFQDDIHRTIRLHKLFENDARLNAMATKTVTSPDAYANSITNVVKCCYDIFNRKLFSLPKVLLLPTVMSKQPLLVAQVFPFIFLSDWLKANAVAYMTTMVETFQKEINELTAIRTKVESFDMKNAELLQRSGLGATQFTQRRWEELTVQIQSRSMISAILTRSKGFFSFIQRNFVFSVLIDCALANLIAVGKIVSADIFVYSRAIEDAVDMMLTRSRGEAELARMMTDVEKLHELSAIWDSTESRALLPCELNPKGNRLVLRNLHYSRGTASARADHIELQAGVYALTGANGSGKSTLFRLLMSCDTNEKSVDLPTSINLLTPMEPLTEQDDIMRESSCTEADHGEVELDANGEIVPGCDIAPHPVPKLSITMPSSQVVEISQNFYWPLYARPIDWIFHERVLESSSPHEVEKIIRKVADELHSLEFFQSVPSEDSDSVASDSTSAEYSTIKRIMMELQEEKEDWFSDLSGGQKSKVELVRKVFLNDRCPDVLLVDETMAPLDPSSKALVMAKLKSFCKDSIIIVIYHTDVGQGKEIEGNEIECVPSNNFFDHNIHLNHGIVHLREIC